MHNEKLQTFILFLKKNNSYEDYLFSLTRANACLFRQRTGNSRIPSEFIITSIKKNPLHLINGAFAWDETNRGYDYWYFLFQKWKMIVKNKKW